MPSSKNNLFKNAVGVVTDRSAFPSITVDNINVGTGLHYYESQGGTNEPDQPVIEVNCDVDWEHIEGYDATVKLWACAVPSGVSGPTTTEELVNNGWIANNKPGSDQEVSFNTWTWLKPSKTLDDEDEEYQTTLNVSGIVRGVLSAHPPETDPTIFSLSGNAKYDVYMGFTISSDGDNNINGYTEGIYYLEGPSGLLTYPPYPWPDGGITTSVEGIGTLTNDVPIQKIGFKFDDPLHLFSFDDLFGDGYTPPANSGCIVISGCAKNLSETESIQHRWVQEYWSTSTSYLPEPTGQYTSPGNTIEWRIPKYKLTEDTAGNIGYAADQYQGYDFYINYINSNGKKSPKLKVTMDSDFLKEIHESSEDLYKEDTVESDQWEGPLPVELNGKTGRKRMAVGIRDIDLESVKYKDKGVYVSEPHTSDDGIYSISLESSEEFPGFEKDNMSPWDYVKYYIQFGVDENADWYRISPKHRIGEKEGDAPVPSIFVLDSSMNGNDKNNINENIKFLTLEKPIRNFRIKVDIDITESNINGLSTPLIYDYKAKVMSRNVLMGGEVERYLFN